MMESQTLLWVGNIDVRLSEYKLLRVLEKFGKLAKFDYLLHQRGPEAGKPRGYAFIGYERAEDARVALTALNGLKFGERYLSVHFANDRKDFDATTTTTTTSNNSNSRNDGNNKPCQATAIISSAPAGKMFKCRPRSPNTARRMQIAAIEAKLKSLESNSAAQPVVNFRGSSLMPSSVVRRSAALVTASSTNNKNQRPVYNRMRRR